MRRLVLFLLVGTIGIGGLVTPVCGNNHVYRRVAPSTVWFFERGSASGVLVDVHRRLVLTAEHVVRNLVQAGRTDVKVIFAQLDKENNVLVEKPFYGFERKKVLAIKGKVVYFNRLKDIALVELERVPAGLTAVPLAAEGPQPGDTIHVIGNSTFFRGGLFSYSSGFVRNSYFYDSFLRGDVFYSLAHHAPTNRGDSGGPVLNDRGELVGIISQGTTGSGEGEQVIDQSVHLKEIRHALNGSNWPLVKSLSCTMDINLPMGLNVPGDWDKFYLPVRKGNNVQVTLRGKGTSDLDLWGRDFDAPPKNQVLFNKEGFTDSEDASFTPQWTGVALLQVRNLFPPNDPNKDQTFTRRNTYNLAINCANAVRGPVTIARALPATGTDTVRVHFDPSDVKAFVRVRGDGDTPLLLSINDPDGQELAKGEGVLDRKLAAFAPPTSGTYTIRVHNPNDRQFNAYVLTID